ncbi:dephospho-CoA kinase [candidate division KSB1 bacterium]
MENSKKRCPVIAVTGGIGSGKSTVAMIFREKGAFILDADSIAKKILWEDPEVHDKVLEKFGNKVCGPDGKIVKEKLKHVVFKDQESILKLNEIVHPVVIRCIFDIINENIKKGTYPLIVVDAALIFESGIAEEFDFVITVAADDEKRIERIVDRDGSSREEILERMELQRSQDNNIKQSGLVIYNNGTEEDLYNDTSLIFEKIVKKELNKLNKG